SSTTSHSTTSKPSSSRGRSASVRGSWSASLKQGIWMMSFIVGDCLDCASGSIPKRTPRSWRKARTARRAPVPFADGRVSMQCATLTRAAPGPIRLARLRGVSPGTWAALALAAMCVLALVGYFVYPTYPTYDSFYALLWGRDVLHLHVPDFRVHRGPTEHPLAIAFGALCSIFGQGGARLMVLGSIASFVAAVCGLYRLGSLCFGRVVGVIAALLLLSRFFLENLAAQGYLDISYIALIVWAVVLEVERRRRGGPVLLVLAAAGLLRPEAWVLVPGAALLALIGAFVLEGAAGASVIDRYLLGGATLMLLFCAVAIGGWSMLEAGSLLRRVWILAAAALLLYGVSTAASTVSLSSLRTTLAYHEDFHKGLAVALANSKVRAQLHRCPLLSLPNNKLIPD